MLTANALMVPAPTMVLPLPHAQPSSLTASVKMENAQTEAKKSQNAQQPSQTAKPIKKVTTLTKTEPNAHQQNPSPKTALVKMAYAKTETKLSRNAQNSSQTANAPMVYAKTEKTLSPNAQLHEH